MLLERDEFATCAPEGTIQRVAETELELPYRVLVHDKVVTCPI